MNLVDLRRIDLNLLVIFQTLVQEGNVTRAAAKLRLTQSAVSAALGRLRKLFDDPLFERSRRGMTPTWRALEISTKLAPTFSSIAEVVFEHPEFEPTRSRRVIQLAMSDDVEIVLAPWLAKKKISSEWSVEFAIHQTNSARWAEAVDDTRIDLAIVSVDSGLSAAYRSEPLISSAYQCLYNPDRVEVSSPITFEEYVSANHVRVSFDAQRGWVDDLMAARGEKRKVIGSISHFAGLVPLLVETEAIATIPDYAARSLAYASGLAVSPCPLAPPHFTISAVWNSRVDGSSENAWLRRLLTEFSTSL